MRTIQNQLDTLLNYGLLIIECNYGGLYAIMAPLEIGKLIAQELNGDDNDWGQIIQYLQGEGADLPWVSGSQIIDTLQSLEDKITRNKAKYDDYNFLCEEKFKKLWIAANKFQGDCPWYEIAQDKKLF